MTILRSAGYRVAKLQRSMGDWYVKAIKLSEGTYTVIDEPRLYANVGKILDDVGQPGEVILKFPQGWANPPEVYMRWNGSVWTKQPTLVVYLQSVVDDFAFLIGDARPETVDIDGGKKYYAGIFNFPPYEGGFSRDEFIPYQPEILQEIVGPMETGSSIAQVHEQFDFVIDTINASAEGFHEDALRFQKLTATGIYPARYTLLGGRGTAVLERVLGTGFTMILE